MPAASLAKHQTALAPWLFERDTFETTDPIYGDTLRFTRQLPPPAADYKTATIGFTDGTAETFVSAIRQKQYFAIILHTDSGRYLDTFYCQSDRNAHSVKLAAWQAFGYGLMVSVVRMAEPWRDGSMLPQEVQ